MFDLVDPKLNDLESNDYVLSENKFREWVKQEIYPKIQKYCDKN